jgi:hypothetical protein
MDCCSLLLGAVGFTVTALGSTEIEAAGQVFLGRRKVDPLFDHDVTQVGAGRGLFKKIQIHANASGVYIFDVNVPYADGEFDDIPTRFHVPQGGFSRRIDLRFSKRHIRNVSFFYGKLPNSHHATQIELWGWR